MTLLDDPEALPSERHAIVIGGGTAGLLATRVLIDHFDQVTIIERDQLPARPAFRKGVPQGHHTHHIMIHGRDLLEQLFPGFEAEIIALGAIPVDLTQDMLWISRAGTLPQHVSGLTTIFCSRDLIEWALRQRVLASGKVRILTSCDMIGLLPDLAGTSVASVQLRVRDQQAAEQAEMTLPANLVVDASGYHSRAPQWLADIGYGAVPETIVNPFRGYASRYYAIPPGFTANWKLLVIQSKPPLGTRFGQLFPVEGNRWLVTLIGAARDYPPTDEENFLAFARSLPDPLLYEIIKDAEPLSAIHGYQHTTNRKRSYETMGRLPHNFIVLGDAVCTLNPSYAQGITAAALGAITLDRCLHEHHRQGLDLLGFAPRFQQALAITNVPLWEKSLSDDLRYKETQGMTATLKIKWVQWYLDQALCLAVTSHTAYQAFIAWMQLCAPLTSLYRPQIMLPVILRALRQALMRMLTAATVRVSRRAQAAGEVK